MSARPRSSPAPRTALRAATAAVLLAATALPAAVATAADDPVTFTVAMSNDVDSLNPFTGIVAESYEVWALVYDTLVGYATDFSPAPGLAESWVESDDGLTWTYTIREGVTWSDGEPLTAADIAYTYNRVMNGEYEQTNWGSYVASITSVEAPDDTTVVMTVVEPSPIMLRLAIPILPEHIWSEIDADEVTSFANEVDVVGSGPFRLVERQAGQSVRLTANPDYWDGAPTIDEVVFRTFGNPDAIAQALKAGEVDFADGMQADVWDSLAGVEGVTQWPAKYYGFDQIAFNTGAALDDGTPIGDGHPALQDTVVRVALNHAVNRQELVDRVFNGNGTAGSTFIPPIYADLHLEPENEYGFDLAEANRLLDDAGYELGADGVRTMPDGSRPLEFRFFARAEDPVSAQTAEFAKGWFAEIGVKLDVEVIGEDALVERVGQGTYDMFEWGWIVEPDPNYQLSTFTCANRSYSEGGQVYANLSDSFYCNEDYDALYAEQAVETDPDARAVIVKQMQAMVYEDAAYAITVYYDNLQAYSDRFTGYVQQPPPDGALLFQYGTATYRNLRLADGSASSSDGGIDPTTIALVVAIVAALGVVALVVVRRRRGPTVEDTE